MGTLAFRRARGYRMTRSTWECPGLVNNMNSGVKLNFGANGTSPGISGGCNPATALYINYDSTLDRHDNTPCALDAFVDYQGKSPMTGVATTPGGLHLPAMNNAPYFNPGTVWTSPHGSETYMHYQPAGVWPY